MTRALPTQTVTAAPIASTTNPFVRNLLVGNPDETETADAELSEGQELGLTKFDTSQSPDNLLLHVLTCRVSKVEDNTETKLTAVAAELHSEVGRI